MASTLPSNPGNLHQASSEILGLTYSRWQEVQMPTTISESRALQIAKDLGDASLFTVSLLNRYRMIRPDRGWQVSNTFGNVYRLDVSQNTILKTPDSANTQYIYLSEAEEDKERIIALEHEAVSEGAGVNQSTTVTLPRRVFADELLSVADTAHWAIPSLVALIISAQKDPENSDTYQEITPDTPLTRISPFMPAIPGQESAVLQYLRTATALTYTFTSIALKDIVNS